MASSWAFLDHVQEVTPGSLGLSSASKREVDEPVYPLPQSGFAKTLAAATTAVP